MYYDVQKSAERIRDLRADSNLTQSEAAERMGFSLSGYRKLEQGQNGGSVDSLIMVADYYNISIDYLVYGEERDYINSLSEGLTDSQKSIVRATTENLIKNIKRYAIVNRGYEVLVLRNQYDVTEDDADWEKFVCDMADMDVRIYLADAGGFVSGAYEE